MFWNFTSTDFNFILIHKLFIVLIFRTKRTATNQDMAIYKTYLFLFGKLSTQSQHAITLLFIYIGFQNGKLSPCVDELNLPKKSLIATFEVGKIKRHPRD